MVFSRSRGKRPRQLGQPARSSLAPPGTNIKHDIEFSVHNSSMNNTISIHDDNDNNDNNDITASGGAPGYGHVQLLPASVPEGPLPTEYS